jgi:hypothetical protein
MRRLVVLGAAAVLSVLGFGAAYVLAGRQETAPPGPGKIAICHSTGSPKNPFVLETPDASGDLDGHEGHPEDIIPAFGAFPGKNMDHIYPGGWTGADILANNCDIPSGGAITETTTTTVTQTVPVTVTTPGTTITTPGQTTTAVITVTVNAPAQTVTTPGTTTVITVPSGATTTVTLPSQTVTLPAVTQTLPSATIERDPVTITVAGTTTTVAAGSTATVVTITGPSGGVEGAVAASKVVTVKVKTPGRTVSVKGHVVHVNGTGMFAGKRFTVLVIRACGCPAGTRLFNGRCRAVVHGEG